MNSDVKCRKVTADEILDLRGRELREGKPLNSGRFPEDNLETTIHYGAFIDDQPVACLTLIRQEDSSPPAWQLRGMATDTRYQRQGIGKTLWNFVEKDLKKEFPEFHIWCNARVKAIPFYTEMGFSVTSSIFHIDQIGLHYKMEKKIV